MAAGAAAGKFLEYESGAPTVAAQTAYGIQAEVEGYADGYDPDSMLFMDFRRHHSGLWNSTAPRHVQQTPSFNM
jgi:lycopene epsilon-cyclase